MQTLFLKAIAVFACSVFLAAFIIIGGAMFGYNHWLPNVKSNTGKNGFMLLRAKEAKTMSKVDILFLGSSVVERGFDPRIFKSKNLQIFNLGSALQTPFSSYFLLKENAPTIKPDYVVLDLYWDVLGADNLESSIDILSNSEFTANSIKMVLESKDMVINTSFIHAYFSRIQTPLSNINQEPIEGHSKYISGGFSETALKKNTLKTDQLESLHPHEISFTKIHKQLSYLNKIIGLCKEFDIKLLFVLVPVTPEYKSKIINYNQYISLISKTAYQNNIPLLNYNDKKDLSLISTTDFFDRNHLTQEGVQKSNEAFIKDFDSLKNTGRTFSFNTAP